MDSRIQQVKIDTAAIRQQLVDHPLYAQIDTLEKLRVFMEHHVFAVWDFMSLLKTLQMQLTCVQVPWVPVGNATTRYLINEIVCGEESDVDEDGNRCSHFELYLKAMNDAGANTAPVLSLLEAVKSGIPIFEAIEQSAAPAAAKQFMQHTFAVINWPIR